MEPRVDEILLPDSLKQDYEAASPLNSLVGIKRLNAFVGPNNSGKSRFLRELFAESQKLMLATTEEHSVQIRSAVRKCLNQIPQIEKALRNLAEKMEETLVAAPFGFHQATQHFASFDQHLHDFDQAASDWRNSVSQYRRHNPSVIDHVRAEEFTRLLTTIYRGVEELAKGGKPSQRSGQQFPPVEPRLRRARFIYIPTLRGMRLSSESESHQHAYFDRTWNDYFKEKKRQANSSDQSIEKARADYHGKTILTGLDLYEWLTNKLLGGLKDRELVLKYQEFLSSTFFQDAPVVLIPRREHDTVNIKVGNEKERPVERLGDGLQQLIILTLPIFEHRNIPLFLFIEEPDLFLHPGFQRVFIDSVLSDKDRELYVFVTTHSSQFLDITVSREDCSVFRFEKKACDESGEEVDPKFSIRNTTFGDSSLLKHIGVRPSSVMFANCTIWVEGVTDRLYFSRFVEIVLKHRALRYTENLHYAFVEYGGGNITHWSFLDDEGIDVERLCARLLLIADHDSGKEERHQILAHALGERFILLPERESENLLTPRVLMNIIQSYEGDEVKLHDFTQPMYASEYLGDFIDNRVLVDKTASKRYGKRKTCYADKSGTVKNKVEFCRRALKSIDSIEDMSKSAINVANKICDFIVSENH